MKSTDYMQAMNADLFGFRNRDDWMSGTLVTCLECAGEGYVPVNIQGTIQTNTCPECDGNGYTRDK